MVMTFGDIPIAVPPMVMTFGDIPIGSPNFKKLKQI